MRNLKVQRCVLLDSKPAGSVKLTIHVAPFFMTFITLTALITLNVFVAVIVDTFAEAASSEGLMATASFFELLKRKMLLDGFAEALKKRLRKHANDVVGNKERHKRR